MVIGADTTLAEPVGNDERKGAVWTLAVPSASALMEKTYVLLAASGGRVTAVCEV